MPTTPKGLPYPSPTDAVSAGAAAIQALANAVDPLLPPTVAPVAYTPAWTADGSAPVLGNGSISGRSVKTGRLVVANVALTAGGTTTFGGPGAWYFALPYAHDGSLLHGSGKVVDASAGLAFPVTPEVWTAGVLRVLAETPGPQFAIVGPAVPFAWAASDQLLLTLVYFSAS